MASEYLSYVKQDEELYRIVEQALPGLETLNVQQVESFIFYLKSLHGYNPASENHVAYYDRFSKQLEELRNSESQEALQTKATRLMLLAMVAGGVGGIVLAVGAVIMLGGAAGWGTTLIIAAMGLFVLAEVRFGKPALETAKEQDRRYFLESLRSARACNELDWAGLFSHNGVTQPGPQSDADIEKTGIRIAELTHQLRTALYNDEYMQYSHPTER